MPELITITGGARIGWINASYPLATLSAGPGTLTIKIKILGNYHFTPDEVFAIEKYQLIPVLASGVRIRHCQPECPSRVIFWCFGDPDAVLQKINLAGFLPAAPAGSVPQRRGLAFRWSFIIVAFIIWNGVPLLAHHWSGQSATSPGANLFALAPVFLAFTVSLGALKSTWLQRLMLKPGRNFGEIKPFLRLLAFISGVMLVIFSLLFASGVLTGMPVTKLK